MILVDDFAAILRETTAQPSNILLEVSVIKIDKTFVDGIELLAEGVENEAQLHELCANGCDLIQGYFFYRPLELAEFIEAIDLALHEDN